MSRASGTEPDALARRIEELEEELERVREERSSAIARAEGLEEQLYGLLEPRGLHPQ